MRSHNANEQDNPTVAPVILTSRYLQDFAIDRNLHARHCEDHQDGRNQCPHTSFRPWFAASAAGHSNQETSMRLTMRLLAAAALTAAPLLAMPAANAQVQSPAPGTSEQAQNIPDEKLDATAAAVKQVASVKENYQGQIEAATPSDRPRIAAEAKTALEEAVTKQGLSVDEYNSILTVAQNDSDVREKILQRVRPPAQ
jgi:hypothetical protein